MDGGSSTATAAGKDFSLRDFEKTLNPTTVKYLNSKTNQLEKLDLRQISDSVVKDLRGLQNEAAIDYLKIERETSDLLNEIENADGILAELESVLKNFRDGLSDVKNEMTFLQEKSLNMNVSLNNRKNLSKTFASFIENVMLEPTLIDDILGAPIDDKYVENIRRLCKKLEYIKKYNLMENMCVREIEPELTKLKIKACDRIRAFIVEEINLMKKTTTNIQVIQNARLIKYKMLMLFLKDHDQPKFLDIAHMYAATLNKFYNHNLNQYMIELTKRAENKMSKAPTILPLTADQHRQSAGFDIGQRPEVLADINAQPIVVHVAQANNQMYPVECLFKSLNRMLVETIGHEYEFLQKFFCRVPN